MTYDLLILGGGAGGFSAAGIARGLGKKVVIVEKSKLGGDCTWFGCVPSKTLIKCAKMAHEIEKVPQFGLKWMIEPSIDSTEVMNHVRGTIQKIYAHETPEEVKKKGIDVMIGNPEFSTENSIRINGEEISAKKLIIATGSRPLVPPIDGLAETPYLTNETLFDLKKLPTSLIILGGGPIGVEMAAALNRLGVQITIVEMQSTLLIRDDQELVHVLSEKLKQEGVRILTSHKATQVTWGKNQFTVSMVSESESAKTVQAEALLVSVGRKANVEGLGLERAGIDYNQKGIVVNKALRTTNPNVYVLGDVVGHFQFSHLSEYHAKIAVPNALLPLPIKKKVNYEHMVWSTFADPELAHSGLTESEARDKYGDSIRIYRHRYSDTDRAVTDGSETGMSKIITDKKGKLLGIHILGERATEIMHEAQVVKVLGKNFSSISNVIHVYPSYGDLVKRPADQCYVDNLQSHWLIRLLNKFSNR